MIYRYKNYKPKINKSVFVAPSADIIGNVEIGSDSSIWFNVTVRGDVNYIRIGKETNIQDNSILHVTSNRASLNIGNQVTVGHGVTLHGCIIEDLTLIGMGAIILDNATISKNSIVAAGSLIPENSAFPPGVLVAGFPAKVKRELTEDEIKRNLEYANHYRDYKNTYLDENQFRKLN